jgi:hypothetical protein
MSESSTSAVLSWMLWSQLAQQYATFEIECHDEKNLWCNWWFIYIVEFMGKEGKLTLAKLTKMMHNPDSMLRYIF